MENNVKTQQEIQQEMQELNNQFGDFLRTKGIAAKFKVAFANMGASARKQHEADVAQFEAVKEQSAKDNPEFTEFLHTKGLKAKYKLVVENLKKGAAAAPQNTAAQIAKVQAQTREAVARANACSKPVDYSADALEHEFQAFLKSKGLDGKYTVTVTEE